MHELSLSELMIGQHHKLLGALHYMVCSFNDIQIASFPLQNAVLMLAFSSNMNISSAESNLLFRNVRKIISECGLSRQQQNDE